MTVPWLFEGLLAEKKTGTAVFTRDTAVKKVYFSTGDIIFASSDQSEDWLGEWLVREGAITREQFDASSELVRKTGKKQGAILVELGFLTPRGLIEGVKFQIKQIIITLFNWRNGTYLFDVSPLPVSDIVPLHMSTGNLIIQGLRNLEWEVVRKGLPSLKTIIRPAVDPSFLFQGADLEHDQRDVFALIDGNRSMEEICRMSGIGDFNTLKAIYVLLALQMVEKGEIKTEEEKKFVCEVVREAVVAEEKKPAEPKAEKTASKGEIQAAYENLNHQNYYELLGVGRDATLQELKKKYFNLAKLYHPDRHFRPDMDEMKGRLETLFAAIHDAYETLIDQGKRDHYDLVLMKRTQKREAAEETPADKPDNRELAVEQYNNGMQQFNAGNFWGSEEAFRWALRLDPGNAEYTFRLGLTLSHIPRRGHDAEEYLKKAIAGAPSNMDYYLALGEFYTKHGVKTKALALYQEALKRNPNAEKIKQAIKKAGE